ncbi:sensor histidine kinase [Spirillospora sp. NPDC052242]
MTLEHRAFVYAGPDDYLEVTVPFLEAGLEAGQAVVAVAREPHLTALRDTLAEHGDAITFRDSADFYRHPVHTLRDYQEIVKASAPRSVCALAEPVWDGWDERQTREWIRYESLINVVFGGSGARALCPYDGTSLPAEVVRQARRTHPIVLRDGRSVSNDEYVRPEAFGAECDRARGFARPAGADHMVIDGADLHALRTFVERRAAAHGLGRTRTLNLVTAVNELAANALQHGTPPAGLRMWADGDDLVCEVGDHGCWRPAPSSLTGFIPPDTALQPGFGLWTVRLLVDLMELRTGWDGTFVRIHTRRAP